MISSFIFSRDSLINLSFKRDFALLISVCESILLSLLLHHFVSELITAYILLSGSFNHGIVSNTQVQIFAFIQAILQFLSLIFEIIFTSVSHGIT